MTAGTDATPMAASASRHVAIAYRPEIDGLRAVAVLLVILDHTKVALLSGGFIGVDVFFVLSGFLITRGIIADIDRGGFSFRGFYERRARRILPALLFVLFVSSVLASLIMIGEERVEHVKAALATLVFGANIYFAATTDYFATSADFLPLIHLWSLGVEEQFYLVFPIVFLTSWRLGVSIAFAAIGFLFCVSLGAAAWGSIHDPVWTYYLLHTRAFEMLIGAGAAIVTARGWVDNRGFLASMASMAGLIAILAAAILYTVETPFPGPYALLPTLGTGLILAFGRADDVAGRVLSLPPVVGIGLISYSAYLWHQPLLAYARLLMPDLGPGMLMVLIGLAALPLAWVTWAFVEKPFRRPREGQGRNFALGAVTVSCLIAVLAVGSHLALKWQEDRLISHVELAFAQAHEERLALNGQDRCHLSAKSDSARFDRFLASWDCTGTGSLDRLSDILIVGDSHGADKAMALRLAGIPVTQLTMPGCTGIPATELRNCRHAFEFLRALVDHTGWKGTLLLGDFLSADERASPEVLLTKIDAWHEISDDIVLMADMPWFADLERRLTRAILRTGDTDLTKHEVQPRFPAANLMADETLLQGLHARGVRIISAGDIFCSLIEDGPACPFVTPQGDLLLTDHHHLSPLSARLFGERLAERLGLVADPARPVSLIPASAEADSRRGIPGVADL